MMEFKRIMRIDIETYSDIDITEYGVYRYVDSPEFDILLFAYKLDNDPVEVIDFTALDENERQRTIDILKGYLMDETVLKTAFNAQFEITALNKAFGIDMPLNSWSCTMVRGMVMGLPGSLKNMAKAMGLEEQKDKEGKALIQYFCKPCKPTKTNGGRTRNLPEHDREKWEKFVEYCRQDVVVETEIGNRLPYLIDSEQYLWEIDMAINRMGVAIDKELVTHAIDCSEQYTTELMRRSKEITGLENPNSTTQLKHWVQEQEGVTLDSIDKAAVNALLEGTLEPHVREVLEMRQELGKSSVKKYQKMDGCLCSDGRVHGLLQFYGANRTGRWAGRLVQVQNLSKNHDETLDSMRELLKSGQYDMIPYLYGDTQAFLSELVRTAFIAKEGHRFIVSDFSAIEARVIAWLGDEKWRINVFNTHGKIYEASASQMFGVPIESVTKGSPLRAKGKVAELACGYQGGVNALRAMDPKWADSVPEAELQDLIDQWRAANPNIVRLWNTAQDCAVNCIKRKTKVPLKHGVVFEYENGCMFIRLPSGRRLCYPNASLSEGRFGNQVPTFYAENDKHMWVKSQTYGGKLIENIVQAIARDCLAESIIRLYELGYNTVMHIHDEVVIEHEEGKSSKEEVMEIMGQSIDWAPGLPLRADAYETKYYLKD